MQPPETLLPAAPEPEDARSREELIAENNPLRLEVAYIKKSTALARARASAAPQKKQRVLEFRPQFPLDDLLQHARLPGSTCQKQLTAAEGSCGYCNFLYSAVFPPDYGQRLKTVNGAGNARPSTAAD